MDDGDEQGLSTDTTSSLLLLDSFDFLFSVAASLNREIKSFETPLQSEIMSLSYCLDGRGALLNRGSKSFETPLQSEIMSLS